MRSKHLDIHLSADRKVTAAWMADDVSWRITQCGRTATIPLRITALYAHDGLSFSEPLEMLQLLICGRPERVLEHERHLIHLPVTGRAANAFGDMNIVLEIDKVRQVMNAGPFQGNLGVPAFANRREFADQAAVDAMRTALNQLAIDGVIVIGEGVIVLN